MGTNYYWKETYDADGDNEGIQCHIGKRSAAGRYCWDCGTTFNTRGTESVHYSSHDTNWVEACPACGKMPEESRDKESTAMVDLGFAKQSNLSLQGVGYCSSFTWTLMKHKWKLSSLVRSEEKVGINEYGDEFTAKEFLEGELHGCAFEMQLPVEFC